MRHSQTFQATFQRIVAASRELGLLNFGTVNEVRAIQTTGCESGRFHVAWSDKTEAAVGAVLEHVQLDSFRLPWQPELAKPIDSAFLLFDKLLTLREIMKQSYSHRAKRQRGAASCLKRRFIWRRHADGGVQECYSDDVVDSRQ